MRTEDDIREAFRELARSAPDADSILADRSGRPDARASRGSRRGHRLLAPIAASAAVVAVIAASIAIGTGGHRGSVVAPGPAGHGAALPPYYVEIMQPPGKSRLVATVRDTRTGAVLATVRPPRGYWFIRVAPGADSDSFLLEANQHSEHPGLYLLRFNPADRRTSLTRLPIAVTLDTDELAMAPSGTEVAVASSSARMSKLQIYTRSGRLIRQWQDPGTFSLIPGPCLSWAAGYLAFSWDNNGTNVAAEGIRLIRATAASGSLIGTSRLVLPFKTVQIASFVLSGDGTTIASDVSLRHPRRPGSPVPGTLYEVFDEFSVATGKLTGQFWPSPQFFIIGTVYWSNWTGSTLIVTAPVPRTARHPRWPFGILTGGKFAPLPTPAGPWFAVAF